MDFNYTPPFPDRKYDVIYADPPWDYSRKLVNPNRGRHTDQNVRDKYETLSTDELKQLPIQSIAADDCLLFLWVVSPKLAECIGVGQAWGFQYITVGFVWHKGRKPLMGHYTMSECELCLIFKHGKIPKPRGKRNIRQFLEVRKGKHSQKPVEVRERITEMFPTQAKIELFARPNWTDYDRGWDFWGNEVSDT